MLEQYFPVLIFMAVGLAVGSVVVAIGFMLGTRKPYDQKIAPYECGFEAFEDARLKFDVRYYLVAILFIIFDLEIAFMFPWAVVLDKVGGFGFAAMAMFLGMLAIGFVFEWRKGALEWE